MRQLFPDEMTIWFSTGLDKYGNPTFSAPVHINGRYEKVNGINFGTQGFSFESDSRYASNQSMVHPDYGQVSAIALGTWNNGPDEAGVDGDTIKGFSEIKSISGRSKIWEVIK